MALTKKQLKILLEAGDDSNKLIAKYREEQSYQAVAAQETAKKAQEAKKRGSFQKAWDQVNPLDSGRSWTTETPSAEQADKSVWTQGKEVGSFLFSGLEKTGDSLEALTGIATRRAQHWEQEYKAGRLTLPQYQKLLQDSLKDTAWAGTKDQGLGDRLKKSAGVSLEATMEIVPFMKAANIAQATAKGGAVFGGVMGAGHGVGSEATNQEGFDVRNVFLQGIAGASAGALGGWLIQRANIKKAKARAAQETDTINAQAADSADKAAKYMQAEDAFKGAQSQGRITDPARLLPDGTDSKTARINEIDAELDLLRTGKQDPNVYSSNPESLTALKGAELAKPKSRTITTYSGGPTKGSNYSTPNRKFAQTFANEDLDGNPVKGVVEKRSIDLNSTLDTSKPAHRALLEKQLGKEEVDRLLGYTDNGLPHHYKDGDQDMLIKAAKDLGFKHIALSETIKNKKFNGKNVVAYIDTQPPKSPPKSAPGVFAKDTAETIADASDTATRARQLMRERKQLLAEIDAIKNPVNKLAEEINLVDDELAAAQRTGDVVKAKTLQKQQTYLAEEATRLDKQIEADAQLNPGLTPVGDVQPLAGNLKPAGLAKSVEAEALDKGLLKEGLSDVSTYGSTTWRSQGEAAAYILENDPEAAMRIAMGTQEPPQGVLANAVFNAVRDKATKEGDVNVIRQLATMSANAPKTSRYAQELGVLSQKDPESPVTAIQSILKAQTANYPNVPPTIAESDVAQITALSQKLLKAKEALSDTPASRKAYGDARIAYDNYVGDLLAQAKKLDFKDAVRKPAFYGQGVIKAAGFTKSLVATLDNSVIGRQGWKTMMTHPRTWARNSLKSFVDIVKVLGGREVMDHVHADIVARDNALNGMYKKMGLDVYGAKASFLEEAYPVSFGKVVSSKPGRIVTRPFKASEAAFSAWQQRTRADLADQYLVIAKNAGVDINDPKQLKAIGKMVNSLTSRGYLGKEGEKIAGPLNALFFSPRLLASHVNVLGGHVITGAGGSNFVRKRAAINLVKIAVGSAMALKLAAEVTGGDLEMDPRSANFGKVKIGSTRFDLTGGMSGLVTLGSRILTQSTKSANTGEVTKLNTGEFGASSTWDVIQNFTENKLSPATKAIVDIAQGKDFSGNKPTPGSIAKSLTMPLIIQQYSELKDTPNSANTLAAMITEALGISVNSYDLQSNWNANNGKEVQAFKQRVSEQSFKEANLKFDERFRDWYGQVSANDKFWQLDQEKRLSLVTAKKNSLTKEVMKEYGFVYKKPKNDDQTDSLINELKRLK